MKLESCLITGSVWLLLVGFLTFYLSIYLIIYLYLRMRQTWEALPYVFHFSLFVCITVLRTLDLTLKQVPKFTPPFYYFFKKTL